MKRLAVFDFCDTLVSFQTADEFTFFVGKRKNFLKYYPLRIIHYALSKFPMITNRLSFKKFYLWQLKGISSNEMNILAEAYFEEKIYPNLNLNILKKLQDHIKNQDKVLIISGGYTVYLKAFADFYGKIEIIATDLSTINKIYTGTIDGDDCLGIEKLKKLSNKFNLSDYDLENSSGYTDSLMDLPLISLFGSKFLVDIGQRNDWAKTLGWKIISP